MARWSLNYIEDAAIVRDRDGNSNYDPPHTGIHLCGQTDDNEQPTTVASYSLPPAQAHIFYERARAAAQCEPEEADFMVDLFIRGSSATEFCSNRQLWPRAIAEWNQIS